MKPSISVVMSCYNARRWLGEAVDSVLSQTYEGFELVLVNDGSTDDTWKLIKSYQDRDNRIVAISKANTGLADSLNIGIEKAQGQWIARLDADDRCEPTRLESQIEFLRNHANVVLLGTGFIEIDEHGHTIKEHKYPSGHPELVQHLERMQRMFPHSSAVFRRDIANDVGLYNPYFRKSQDWDLWLRFAERGRIACLENCLVKVRKHASQISSLTTDESQLLFGIAASTCHFLRLHGDLDPSTNNDEKSWNDFLDWVQERVTRENVLEMQKAWANARTTFISAENWLKASFGVSAGLLRSGYTYSLLAQRLFGSSLPKRLAQEWMTKSCAAY